MSVTFNAEEIFRMAEQIERNGVAYYKKAAERFEGELKQKLLGLAAMEEGHEAYFKGLRKEIFGSDPTSQMFDPEGEVERYLAALTTSKIFDVDQRIEAVLGDEGSLRGILQFAVEREKESVLYYLGLKKIVPEKLGKERIEAIINEEMAHVALLTDELLNLKN